MHDVLKPYFFSKFDHIASQKDPPVTASLRQNHPKWEKESTCRLQTGSLTACAAKAGQSVSHCSDSRAGRCVAVFAGRHRTQACDSGMDCDHYDKLRYRR